MTQYAYPLDDTEYLAEQVRLFHSARTAGLINATGDDLAVESVGGMTVGVKEGVAFLLTSSNGIGGITYANDEEVRFTVDIASSFDRYDYISVRYDKALNKCELNYVKGGSSKPTPIRNANQYELIIAIIQVKANTASIANADITDTRLDENLCGLAVDGLVKLPTEGFNNQFKALMESIQGTLSDDVAGNLLLKINDNTTAIEANETAIEEAKTSIDEVSQDLADFKESAGYVVVTEDPTVTPPTTAKEGWIVLYVDES